MVLVYMAIKCSYNTLPLLIIICDLRDVRDFCFVSEKNIISFVSLCGVLVLPFSHLLCLHRLHLFGFFWLHCVLCPALHLVAIQLHPLDLIPMV